MKYINLHTIFPYEKQKKILSPSENLMKSIFITLGWLSFSFATAIFLQPYMFIWTLIVPLTIFCGYNIFTIATMKKNRRKKNKDEFEELNSFSSHKFSEVQKLYPNAEAIYWDENDQGKSLIWGDCPYAIIDGWKYKYENIPSGVVYPNLYSDDNYFWSKEDKFIRYSQADEKDNKDIFEVRSVMYHGLIAYYPCFTGTEEHRRPSFYINDFAEVIKLPEEVINDKLKKQLRGMQANYIMSNKDHREVIYYHTLEQATKASEWLQSISVANQLRNIL